MQTIKIIPLLFLAMSCGSLEPPSNLSIDGVGNDSAMISFSPPSLGNWSSFKMNVIHLGQPQVPPRAVLFNNTEPNNLTGLTPGGTYQLQLFTVHKSEESAAHISKNFTTRPNMPRKITVWFRNETALLILWQPSFPASIYNNYKVSIDPPDAAESVLYVEKKDESTEPAQAAFTSLFPGRAYNLSVQTVSQDETSPPRTIMSHTIPFKPANVKVDESRIFSHGFTVTWEPPTNSSEFDKYLLTISPNVPNAQPVITINKDEPTQYTFEEGLEPGLTYHVVVKTASGKLASWPAATDVMIPPEAPTNVTIEVLGSNSAIISFSPPSIGRWSSFKINVINQEQPHVPPRTILFNNTKPYNLTGLTPGGTYQLQLFTVHDSKESAAYISRNFTTRPNIPGKIITWFRNETALLILWQPSLPASIYNHYKVSIDPPDATESVLYVGKGDESTGTAQAAFTALFPGRAYNLTVQTISQEEMSAPKTIRSRTVPFKPANLKVYESNIASRSFTVTWEPPTNPSEFDKYLVSISSKDLKSKPPITINKDEPTQYTFEEGLEPGLTYHVVVKTTAGKLASWPATINVTLEDKSNAQVHHCKNDEFKCSSGQCINRFLRCDGARDCQDGSDETSAVCSGLRCPEHSFRCTYGACVETRVKCDGKKDCADNSDELSPDCPAPFTGSRPQTNYSNCTRNQFACNSGQCIQKWALCDGLPDCNDWSDETIRQCSNIRCPPKSFQCAYGACIELEKRCNGVEDCSDSSDEGVDLCSYSSPPTSPAMSSGIGCRIPEKKEGTNYRVYSTECLSENTRSKCHFESGSLVSELTNLIYECDRGYALGSDGDHAVCRNGSWHKELQCLKLCKPLVAEFMELKCFYHAQSVPCDVAALPGTIVRPSCARFYTAVLYDLFRDTQCSITGEWELPLYRCLPVCGRRWYNSWQTLIAHGTNASVGEYPWHVGLYELKKGHFKHICGGTIISPYLILTAAHCVFNDVTLTLQNPDKLRVVVGKYYISWDRQDRYEQRLEIKRIIPSDDYGGSTNSYSDDIAALELKSRISFSNVVQPACLHLRKTVPLRNGAWGTVVGWGHDEFSTPTNELRAANLTYMDRETCRANAPFDFLMSITSDKFCAGSKVGSVQPGDSGGGFTVVLEDRHHLIGIVSIRPNQSTSFAAYTSIAKHVDWIIDLMADLRTRHPL